MRTSLMISTMKCSGNPLMKCFLRMSAQLPVNGGDDSSGGGGDINSGCGSGSWCGGDCSGSNGGGNNSVSCNSGCCVNYCVGNHH